VVLVVATAFLLSLGGPAVVDGGSPAGEVRFTTQWQPPIAGSWYEYAVAIKGTSEMQFAVTVSVIEASSDSLTIETAATGTGLDPVIIVDSFAITTRAHASYPGYFGWFWATPYDLASSSATFGILTYAPVGQVNNGFHFAFQDGKGTESHLKFRSTDLILSEASAVLQSGGKEWSVTARLVLEGQATAPSIGTPVFASQAQSGDIGTLSHLVYNLQPPYSSSGGYKYTFVEGVADAYATYGHSWYSGREYNRAEVVAGLPYGRARADSFAYIYGPQSSFDLSETRSYSFNFRLTLTGAAETSRTLCTFLGCMSAQSKISFTGKILTTSYTEITRKECVLYEGSNLGAPKYKDWNNEIVYCGWTAYLSSGSYIFKGELFTVHTAANVLIGLATASSQLTVYITNVYIYKA
jgi:hypothetical protein